jgi:A/G-specific adenine glycosylase
MKNKKLFSSSLYRWNDTQNNRQMPWKEEKNPYKIWISEIILQQTRVQQGINYYNRFIHAFPDIEALATAPEKKVYKIWEGLGYYTRCKNLIATAKFIHQNLHGNFPEEYEEILSLKGIGNYTASAIASFAFNQPYAVLDGNVFRVLSRFFGQEIPVNTSEGKKFYSQLSQLLLDKKNPAKYNQAIMDFGAIVCKPLLPLCFECALKKGCVGFLKDKVAQLPVNKKLTRQKERFFTYVIIENNKHFYVNKRTAKDIWQNLYEFILVETADWKNENEILQDESILNLFNKRAFTVKSISKKVSQKLTHQRINGRFIHLEIKKPLTSEKYFPVSQKQLKTLPFPKLIASYLTDKNVSLNSI